MHIENVIAKGQLVTLSFGQDTVAASQTDVQLNVALGEAAQAVDSYYANFNGEIVGLGYTLSVAGTTGAFTIGPTIDGTENTTFAVTVGTTTEGGVKIPRGKMPFSRGQNLGVEITTAAGWDGTTADLSVQLYVLYYLEGI